MTNEQQSHLRIALAAIASGALVGAGVGFGIGTAVGGDDTTPDTRQDTTITQPPPAESMPPDLHRYALEQAWAQFPPEDHAAICSLDLEWATDQIVAGVTEADLDPYMVRDFLIEKCEEF